MHKNLAIILQQFNYGKNSFIVLIHQDEVFDKSPLPPDLVIVQSTIPGDILNHPFVRGIKVSKKYLLTQNKKYGLWDFTEQPFDRISIKAFNYKQETSLVRGTWWWWSNSRIPQSSQFLTCQIARKERK